MATVPSRPKPEAAAISERTKAALAAAKARGVKLGSARPGHWDGREDRRLAGTRLAADVEDRRDGGFGGHGGDPLRIQVVLGPSAVRLDDRRADLLRRLVAQHDDPRFGPAAQRHGRKDHAQCDQQPAEQGYPRYDAPRRNVRSDALRPFPMHSLAARSNGRRASPAVRSHAERGNERNERIERPSSVGGFFTHQGVDCGGGGEDV